MLIYVICDGDVIYKNYVNNYGGVLIQKCNINKRSVTVFVWSH